MIQITTLKPVNYPHIIEKFGNDIWDKGVVITYGNKIHCKAGNISPQIMEHEQVHVHQQIAFPGGAAAWWREYIRNARFRLHEELEAHKVEAAYVRKHVSNHKKQAEKLDYIAHSMANNYSGMISYSEAKELL